MSIAVIKLAVVILELLSNSFVLALYQIPLLVNLKLDSSEGMALVINQQIHE